MSLLAFALALAAAAQDAPARSADAEILSLFDAVCVRGGDAPAGFQPVEWSSFPAELRFMNTYGHGGTFLRAETGGRVVYIARTAGPGHDSLAAGEQRCGVAIRGANFSRLLRAIGDQLRTRPIEISLGGMRNVVFPAEQGALSVSEAEGGWIIVRAYGISMRAN